MSPSFCEAIDFEPYIRRIDEIFVIRNLRKKTTNVKFRYQISMLKKYPNCLH